MIVNTSQGSVEIPAYVGRWFMQPTYVCDNNAVDIAGMSERLGLHYLDVSGSDVHSVTTLVVQEVTRRIGDSQLRPVVWLMMSRQQYDTVRLSMEGATGG